MPPRRRPIDPDELETYDSWESTEADSELERLIRQTLSVDQDYYKAGIRESVHRIEAVHSQLQRILTDFQEPDGMEWVSERQKANYFISKIRIAETRFEKTVAKVFTEQNNLWLFIGTSPLKISGALFSPEIAGLLEQFRAALSDIFMDLQGERFYLDDRMAETQGLLEECKGLVHPGKRPRALRPGPSVATPGETTVSLGVRGKEAK